jgi:serine/threonine protein kinase
MDNRLDAPDAREQRLNDVLGAYLEAADAGWAPNQEELAARYPDLADDLHAFFVAQSRVAALAYPCPTSVLRRDKAGRDTAPAPFQNGASATSPAADYEALLLLKEGGMGAVYRAWQIGAKRWVALKKIKAGRLASSTDVRRFLDEAEAAASLDHPNIVPIYDVGEHNGQPFYSMKLFDHGSLHQHLSRFQNDPRAAARLVATVARAVHFAHQRGILHRDLKPANILLDAQEQPYVADFGLAKRLRPTPDVTAGGAPTPPALPKKGAPPTTRDPQTALDDNLPFDDFSYLAPEQARATEGLEADKNGTVTAETPTQDATGVGAVVGTQGYLPPEHAGVTHGGSSTAADVYSLGAILYKLLTGTTLFKSDTLADVVRKVKECAPERPRRLNPKIEARLEAVCLKCLEKDPARRYASAQALAEDLDRWLNGEPPLAWPMPWWLRIWRTVQRHAIVTVLAALAGFAAAAVFFAVFYFDPERASRNLVREAKDRRVTLIGATGFPRWQRWNSGEGLAMVAPDVDRPFSFATLDIGRLELLPKAPAPHYRIAAELRHDDAYGKGRVGLYFAHVEHMAEAGVTRYWCDLTFADRGADARSQKKSRAAAQGTVALALERYALPKREFLVTETVDHFQTAEVLGKPAADWRRLEVEISPEGIQVTWEGKPLKDLGQAKLRALAKDGYRVADKIILADFQFDPAGAVGLYVERSKASFRNVIVEPLE